MAYYEDIIVTEKGQTVCELCQIYLTTDSVIEFHINSKTHQDIYMHTKMVQNSIIVRENNAHCLICKVDLEDLIFHINTSQHQCVMNKIIDVVENDGAFLDMPQNIQQSGSKVHCTICNSFAVFNFQSLKEHVNSNKHRRARSMVVQPYNGIFSVEDSNDDLWCKICQIYFENYIETIFEHVDEDKEHKTKLTKILKLIEGQNITIDKYLTNIKHKYKATCNKCDTGVACNVDNLERHIKGKRHNNS